MKIMVPGHCAVLIGIFVGISSGPARWRLICCFVQTALFERDLAAANSVKNSEAWAAFRRTSHLANVTHQCRVSTVTSAPLACRFREHGTVLLDRARFVRRIRGSRADNVCLTAISLVVVRRRCQSEGHALVKSSPLPSDGSHPHAAHARARTLVD